MTSNRGDSHIDQGSFLFPNEIYGKVEAIALFKEAVDEYINGNSVCVDIFGEKGVGKSFFLRRMLKDYPGILNFRIYFDARNHHTPYQPFNELINQLIEKLRDHVGHSKFELWLIELSHKFSWIDPTVLSNIPTLNNYLGRFSKGSSNNFIEPIAKKKQIDDVFREVVLFIMKSIEVPKVLIFEDMHLVSLENKKLIYEIFQGGNTPNLFVLLGRGDGWIMPKDDKSPLTIKEEGAHQFSLQIDNLNIQETKNYLADTLKGEIKDIDEFCQLVWNNTSGNLQHTHEFLIHLLNSNKLQFVLESKVWHWTKTDLSQVGNEDSFDLSYLELSAENKEILKFISCFSGDINLILVANIGNYSRQKLKEAFLEFEECDFIESTNSESINDDGSLNYKFCQAETQNKAYQHLNELERSKYHRKIAHHYIKSSILGVNDRDLFDVVNHLNNSKEISLTDDERVVFVNLNLRAAKRAKQMAAYEIGLTHVKEALSLEGISSCDRSKAICKQIILEGYQLARLNRDEEFALELFNRGNLQFSEDELFQLRLAKIILDVQFGELQASMETGVQTLRELGIRVSVNSGMGSVLKEIVKTRLALVGKSEEEIYNLPPLSNQKVVKAFQVFFWMYRSTNYINPVLNGVLALKQLQLMLKFGTNGDAYSGLMAYGVIIGAGMNDLDTAFKFCDVGRRISEKYHNNSGKVDFGRAIYWPFKYPLEDSLKFYDSAIYKEQNQGDFLGAAEAMINQSLVKISIGDKLDEIEVQVLHNLKFCESIGAKDYGDFQRMLLINIKLLRNQEISVEDNEVLNSICDNTEFKFTISVNGVLQMMSAAFRSDWNELNKWSASIEKKVQNLSGLYFKTEYDFFQAVGLLKSNNGKTISASEKRKIKSVLKRMKKWSSSVPSNYEHKVHVLEGLILIAEGKISEGIQLLNRGLELTKQRGFSHLTGLIKQLLRDVYENEGKDEEVKSLNTLASKVLFDWGRNME